MGSRNETGGVIRDRPNAYEKERTQGRLRGEVLGENLVRDRIFDDGCAE